MKALKGTVTATASEEIVLWLDEDELEEMDEDDHKLALQDVFQFNSEKADFDVDSIEISELPGGSA